MSSRKVAILTQRSLDSKVHQCWMYEFEQIIAGLEDVTFYEPRAMSLGTLKRNVLRLGNLGCKRNRRRNVSISRQGLTFQDKFDLFFAVFAYPSQMMLLNSLKGWQENCRLNACYIGEVWTKNLDDPVMRSYLALLQNFDQVFVHTGGSASKVSEIIGRPCHAVTVGIDAPTFCPYPHPPHREIDVYSMGRRSETTHQVLLRASREHRIFYIHDTAAGFSVNHWEEHRSLVAALTKRSKLFIAYKHNINLTPLTGGQEELGSRLFEGAAGGTVLIGVPPSCTAYDLNFDWEDAVIHIPYDCLDIEERIKTLIAQPERMATIRRNNVVNSLQRHDWMFRWEQILQLLGLEPSPGAAARKALLDSLTDLAVADGK